MTETAYPGISLVADAAVAAQDDACSAKVEPGVGNGSSDDGGPDRRIPSVKVGAAARISVAGRSGTMFDVSLKPGWDRFCSVGGGVPVIRENVDSADGLDWRMTATGRWRVILVDVAPGRTMAIVVDALGEPSQFDALVAEAMPIVTSFELHPPTP